MGLFDRIVQNVARNVVNDAVRDVEYKASRTISNSVTNAAGHIVEQKKAEYHEKAEFVKTSLEDEPKRNEAPSIKKNTDTSETLRFASEGKVYYHYTNPSTGASESISMLVSGNMTFPISGKGKYEGNSSVAYGLTDAIYKSLQAVLDEMASEGVDLDTVLKKKIALTNGTKEKMASAAESYGIERFTLLYTCLTANDKMANQSTSVSATANAMPMWKCEYCGTSTSGNFCSGCGAPRG